jgi:hypothetical protein
MSNEGGSGANSNRDFNLRVATVADFDCHQPVSRRSRCGEDALDAQIGQTFVGINPVSEKPRKIGMGLGFFEELFKIAACGRLVGILAGC